MNFGLLIQRMNYQQFRTMPDVDRAALAWKDGVLLCERTEAFHKMLVYQMDDFYMEVTYHTHFNVVLKTYSFKDPRFLDPYLSSIDLSGLMA